MVECLIMITILMCNFFFGCVQLLYVDSLDASNLGIEVVDAPFFVNAWSREAVDAVLLADAQKDRKCFGKLEVDLC